MHRKYMVLMFVGLSIVVLSFSATAEEETPLHKIVSREVGSDKGPIDGPVVEPVNYEDLKEDLIIAPDPGETIEHDSSKGQREYENVVGENCDQDTPHILDMGNDEENNKETIDASLAGVKNSEKIKENNLSSILIISSIGVIGFLLIIVKKKEKKQFLSFIFL